MIYVIQPLNRGLGITTFDRERSKAGLEGAAREQRSAAREQKGTLKLLPRSRLELSLLQPLASRSREGRKSGIAVLPRVHAA